MKVHHIDDIEETKVEMEGAKDARMRLLISEREGAENFAMRLFTVAPGGHTPYHQHNYEHEIFVLSGKGVLRGEKKKHELRSGDAVFVAPNEEHQFVNTGSEPFQFLCLIPAPEKCA